VSRSIKHRRIDIFGHQTSLALEPEYWAWLREITAKTGASLKDIVEAIAANKNPHRSLASEIRVAVAAYFHGNPYPIYRCPAGMVPMRNGDVSLGWPGGRRREHRPSGRRPHASAARPIASAADARYAPPIEDAAKGG
jgi:predicted DNA-binding ribbon-helix-helix protein